MWQRLDWVWYDIIRLEINRLGGARELWPNRLTAEKYSQNSQLGLGANPLPDTHIPNGCVCATKLSFLISCEEKKKERKKNKYNNSESRTGSKIINMLFIVFSFSFIIAENVMSMWHNGFVIDLVKKYIWKNIYINCVFMFIFILDTR